VLHVALALELFPQLLTLLGRTRKIKAQDDIPLRQAGSLSHLPPKADHAHDQIANQTEPAAFDELPRQPAGANPNDQKPNDVHVAKLPNGRKRWNVKTAE
jgi:hypothetical protein